MKDEEKNLQEAILDYLGVDKRGYFWRNNTGIATFGERKVAYGKKGSADIIGMYKGQFIGIEVKSKRGKQSEDQKTFQYWVTVAGGVYYLANDIDKFLEWFNKLKMKL